MRSSTSSSNTRIPAISYKKEWGYIALLFVGLIISMECYYRQAGHKPSLTDSSHLWGIHRTNVYTSPEGNDGKRIVIIGGSRAQLGLVPATLEQAFPGNKVIQLAIDATPGYGVAEDLCNDPEFDGVILYSATADNVFPGDASRKDHKYTNSYHQVFKKNSGIEKKVNCYIGTFLQERLVVLSSNLSIKPLLINFSKSNQLKPSYTNMSFNRSRPAHYHSLLSQAGRDKQKRMRISGRKQTIYPLNVETFDKHIHTNLSDLYSRLRSRGGELILIRMPTTDGYWDIDEEAVPKKKFWDQITDATGIPTIHFRDYPELMEFDCPDASHLDWSDAPKFTQKLSKILKAKLEANKIIWR